ncbi:MAG: M14 family metallopeptidase [Gammaproteobacteria bacterium]|nr:M14 family metallopeptidase [Gammaproteobacteria bacterium]
MLTVLDRLPPGLLDADPLDLHGVLGGPTLIHLPGRREQPLFVSTLLHGNEVSGLLALQALLRRYVGVELPRALSVFIGNVAAARDGLRHLPGQPDFNRIWKPGPTAEHAMARRVIEEMRPRRPFVSVDVHNNTGVNPHYGCVNRLDHRFLHLAALFGRTVVYFTQPDTVQSRAFAELCPAVTLECGKSRDPLGVERATAFLDACLRLAAVPEHPVAAHDLDLFHTVARVEVEQGLRFGFGECGESLCFPGDMDHLNFRELPADTVLATRPDGARGTGLVAVDEAGRNVTARYFGLAQGQVRLLRPLMPSMLTLDATVIRQDCLCYVMERIDPVQAAASA